MATKAKVVKGRISLQANLVRRLGGDEATVWLFVVDPGHLRVLSQQEASGLVDLEAFSDADALTLQTREERELVGALRLRLISAGTDKRRLRIPAEAFDVCGEYLDRSYVWLEESSARIDLFTATYVQRALARSPSDFLREPPEVFLTEG